ncbi:MAG: lactate racemase domain-containing protein [Planctomycetaceae bacterium]|nr:lactate racemase domain-containing protein [Planctomycetaceae bacterium]
MFTKVFQPAASKTTDVDIPAVVARAVAALGKVGALTLLVNDPQRATDSGAILRALPEHVDPARIRILVATGSHKFPVSDQAAFERSLLDGLSVEQVQWHDGGSASLRPVAGAWRVHPWLLDERPLLAVGSVEPHYFAGFTGAHKTATIGCAAVEDITANHRHAVSPRCRPCRIDDNPVHEGIAGMLAALTELRPVQAINLVQVGRTIADAQTGSPLEALPLAAPAAMNAFCCQAPKLADAIVAQVEGPLGVSLYQADKGIKNTEWALREGGALILEAPCPKGIGQHQFTNVLKRAASYDEACAVVEKDGYRLGDHKALRLRYLTDRKYRNVRLMIVSPGLTDEDAALLGATRYACVGDALKAAGVDASRNTAYCVKDAGNVCLVVAFGEVTSTNVTNCTNGRNGIME